MYVKVCLSSLILVLLPLFEDQIVDVIDAYEPRVTNLVVQVDPQPDNNSFGVNVIFDISGLAVPTQQFSFLLEATR